MHEPARFSVTEIRIQNTRELLELQRNACVLSDRTYYTARVGTCTRGVPTASQIYCVDSTLGQNSLDL